MRAASPRHDCRLRPHLVASRSQLDELLEKLYSHPIIAVDTESNSLHAYREQVCLIQFSTDDGDYLLDPLARLDPTPLGAIFADPGVEKIFHAAEYDVMCLKRDFGFQFTNIFDTMWAARILGWPKVGLGDILMATFSVETNKHYQRYDWGLRPIAAEALTYACLDTHYLLPLRRLQSRALLERGRWEEAQEVFSQVADTTAAPRSFDPQDFWRIKGASRLTGRQQAILRQLFIWRDREARHKGTPPFKILSDATLVALVRAKPASKAELTGIRGLRPHHVQRFGDRILRAVERGGRSRPPSPPKPPPRHSRRERQRFSALRAWRREKAASRGVDSDVILSNQVLWMLAEDNPETVADLENIEPLGPWKREQYAADILRVLKGQ